LQIIIKISTISISICSLFFFFEDADQAVAKIFDPDDEDLGNLSDASSRSTASSLSSTKSSSKVESSKKNKNKTDVKIKDKENFEKLKLSIVIENSLDGHKKYAARRKSCIPNLTVMKTDGGFVKKPPEVVRVTRSTIKTTSVTPKSAAPKKDFFKFSSDSDDNDSVLSYVTKSGRKSKAVLTQVTEQLNSSKDISIEEDGDSDFKEQEQNESESESEDDGVDEDALENVNESESDDFESEVKTGMNSKAFLTNKSRKESGNE